MSSKNNEDEDYCFWCGEVAPLHATDSTDMNGLPVRLCKNCKDGDDECNEYLEKLSEKNK